LQAVKSGQLAYHMLNFGQTVLSTNGYCLSFFIELLVRTLIRFKYNGAFNIKVLSIVKKGWAVWFNVFSGQFWLMSG